MELQESIGGFVDIFVDTGSSIALIFRRFLPKPLIIRDFQIFHAFFTHFLESQLSEKEKNVVYTSTRRKTLQSILVNKERRKP